MLIRKSVIFPLSEKLLTNPSGQTHPLVINQTLTLVAFRGHLFEKRISVKAANLISNSRRQSLSGYEWPWKKWSGVIEGRLIHFDVLYLVGILDYLTSLFEEGFEYNTTVVHSSTISAYQFDDMLLWANIL